MPILAKSVMSLYEGARRMVTVHYELLEEFGVKVGMHQGCVQSTFLFALVVDVVTEFARGCAELLHADDIVLMSDTIVGHMDKFLKWKEAFESKGLKVNLVKTKVMVSSGITKDGMSNSEVDPCNVCSM